MTLGNVRRGVGHASIFSVLYILEKHKIQADKLKKQTERKFIRYKKDLETEIAKRNSAERIALDQRFDPELVIHNGVQYLAGLCRTCVDRFRGFGAA